MIGDRREKIEARAVIPSEEQKRQKSVVDGEGGFWGVLAVHPKNILITPQKNGLANLLAHDAGNVSRIAKAIWPRDLAGLGKKVMVLGDNGVIGVRRSPPQNHSTPPIGGRRSVLEAVKTCWAFSNSAAT